MCRRGELTAEDWYAYKARWRHYDSERLRRGMITKEQFDRGNSLAQMWGDLDELMKKARIDFKPGTLPDFLQRIADERVRSARGAGETGDGESLQWNIHYVSRGWMGRQGRLSCRP